jgi:hypothetical protein
LKFDHEEVEKLLNIVEETFKGLFGDGEVLARAHTSGQTIAKECLSGDFSTSSNYPLLANCPLFGNSIFTHFRR